MKTTAKRISIDTNILVRLSTGDIPSLVEAANRCVESHQDIHVSDVAVAETQYVLARAYGFSRQEVADTLLAILARPNITCNLERLRRSFAHYCEHSALSFEDCYLAIQAHDEYATPLLTFDKKLVNQLQYTELLVS